MKRTAVSALTLALCCCREPDYPPPPQRPVFDESLIPPARILNMDDPGVSVRFVRDISDGLAANWRWTGRRPAVRIRVRSNQNLKYTIDFTLPEATIKDTGPVTITFLVNDHVLDRVRYASQGFQHFEKRVPPEWLENYKDAIVGAEIDKPWISKIDGAQLGFILTRIGLAP